MKRPFTGVVLATTVFLVCSSAAMAQSTPAGTSAAPAASSGSTGTSKQNLAEDIKLLRKDVRTEKSKIMGAAMGLDAEQSKKVWPIYKDYDRQLAKLNDVRLGNIIEYAKTYVTVTENKAAELVNGAIAYRKKRIDLLANTYDKVRGALGAPLGARFLQIHYMLLKLMDMQVQSFLPLMWGPENG